MLKEGAYQNFLKHLSALAISLTLLFVPTYGHSQECSFVYDDGELVERAIEVDGDTFLYFPIDKAIEMQKTLEKFESKVAEIKLLESKVILLTSSIVSKDGQIDMLRRESGHLRDLSLKALDINEDSGSIINNTTVTYIAGVLTTVTMFFLWEYARTK